jgi:hypothetical protein
MIHFENSRADMGMEAGRLGNKLNAPNKNKVLPEETFTITLSETNTILHLSLPSYVVPSDIRDQFTLDADERNSRYEACIKAHQNPDGFTARSSQTKNNQLKNQNEMAAPNAFKDSGTQAISYEIKDEINETLYEIREKRTDIDESLNFDIITE